MEYRRLGSPKKGSDPARLARAIGRRTFVAGWTGLTAGSLAACRRSPLDALTAKQGCKLVGKQVQWIVPNAPGGSYDAYSRLLAPFLEQELGARIVVRNLPGASGISAAAELSRATPDGTVLGILSGPGLLVASLAGVSVAPEPLRDFTILLRIARSRHVWVTGANSGLHSMQDVFKLSRTRPLVFAVNTVGGVGFVSIVLTAQLLTTPSELVTGFQGSQAVTLAAIRGDVDLVSLSWETVASRVGSGDLRPLLQISGSPVSSDSLLHSTPLLGGVNGIAADRARQLGTSTELARQEATALEKLLGGGKIIVGPAGMPRDLQNCLAETLVKTLSRSDLRTTARALGRTLDVADAHQARRDLEAAAQIASRYLALIRREIAKIRG
jgi:tripartite-type tricarboxylate transporter receptor subunit TctC